MKWVVLALLLAMIPVLSGWLRANPRHVPKIGFVVGLLPLLIDPFHLSSSPIAYPLWPGFVRGITVTALDSVALAICLATPASKRRFGLWPPIVIYLAFVTISIFQASVPMATVFDSWQLMRVLLVAIAVSALCRYERAPYMIIAGMAAGLGYHAALALMESASGSVQSGGGFMHQNLLGLISHFVVFPSLALILAGRPGWYGWVGVGAGMIVEVLTASRATIGLAGLGFGLMFILSIAMRPTSRKTMIVGGGIAALSVATLVALTTLARRFGSQSVYTEEGQRAQLERVAGQMLRDHPMGVGANHYVLVANAQDYYQRAGVGWQASSRGATVHNAYLLAGAELGYLGMAAFVLFVVWPIVTALSVAWRHRRVPRAEILLGCAVAMIVAGIHSQYEWIFVTASPQYLYAIAVGMVAGIAYQLERDRKPVRRRRPL